jgi:hypothetical protein
MKQLPSAPASLAHSVPFCLNTGLGTNDSGNVGATDRDEDALSMSPTDFISVALGSARDGVECRRGVSLEMTAAPGGVRRG